MKAPFLQLIDIPKQLWDVTQVITPEDLKKENRALHARIAFLEEQVSNYESIIAMKDQEIVALKTVISVPVQPPLSLMTPQKGQYYPLTPYHPSKLSLMNPLVKTESAVKDEKIKPFPLSNHPIFFQMRNPLETPLPILSIPTLQEPTVTVPILDHTKVSASILPEALKIEAFDELPYNHENKKSLKNEMIKQYENTDYTFEGTTEIDTSPYVFGLNQIYWPILPMGYKWYFNGEFYQVIKHKNADKVAIRIKIFGPDFLNKINYLSFFNDVIVQSYANTRIEGHNYNGKRGDAEYIDSAYQGGHCIDHKDTIEEDPIEFRSSIDSRNFIPEPKHWNNFKNHYVRHQIRKFAGSYMQRIYYHSYLPYCYNLQMEKTDGTSVYLPEGVYFAN